MVVRNLLKFYFEAPRHVIQLKFELITQKSISRATIIKIGQEYDVDRYAAKIKPLMSKINAEMRLNWANVFLQEDPTIGGRFCGQMSPCADYTTKGSNM